MKNCTSGFYRAASVLRRVWAGQLSTPFYVFSLILILLVGSSRAKADIDTYVFSSGTSTNLNGDTEDITGGFTFDTTTDIATAVSITLTGASPYAGTYSNSSDTCSNPCTAIFATSGVSTLFVHFDQGLGVSPDDLQSTEWSSSISPGFGSDGSPTGAAVFASTSAVPEPSSVFLLVTMVAMLGLLRIIVRARRCS